MEIVAAIVPTFNRKNQLRESLCALIKQTRPLNQIFVIDNGGTDGSQAMIKAEFPEVRYVRLDVNGGSSGGFRAGMELAYNEGYEWLWLADDDAFPAPNALELLMEAAHTVDGKVFNSLVVTPDGETVNWGYQLYCGESYQDGFRTIRSVRELEKLGKSVLNGLAQFNTGSLISRQVIEAVGFHNHGLFIRGEEVDYVLRIQRAGFKTYTVIGSKYFHPAEPQLRAKFLGRDVVIPLMTPAKQYYCLRNGLINARRYNFTQEFLPFIYMNLFLRHCRDSLVYPDQRARRLLYMIYALADGLTGRAYVRNFDKDKESLLSNCFDGQL